MVPFDLINTERYRGSPFSVTCPHCGSVATYREVNTKTYPTHASQIAVDLGGAEPEVYAGTIFGECGCNNRDCQESVHFIGEYVTEYDDSTIPAGYPQKFVIRYFFPAVPLIRMPPETPEIVSAMLKRSFAPAFMDQSASGNLLRIAIEKLLTELRVPRFMVGKGKRNRMTLHSRIEALPQELASYKEALLAIKWIGNAASHDDLNVNSLRVAFEIIQDLIEELYGTRKRDLLRKIQEINRRKKP